MTRSDRAAGSTAAARTRSGGVSRRTAACLLALLVAGNLALGFHGLRHGLPHVFHADSAQIVQAATLLRNGWYPDHAPYPPPLVFVYAAAARVAYQLEALGIGPAPRTPRSGDWPAFVERFQDVSLQHAIGRAVSVLAGGVLVLATYRLGRVCFSRAVSLLAAAAIAVDPVLVITEHQVRPHVPAAAALVLAAPLMLRLVQRAAVREASVPGAALAGTPADVPASFGGIVVAALAAGAAAGVATAVLQLGALLAAAGVALLLMLARPLWRACVLSAAVGAGTLATVWTIHALCRATGMVRPVLVRTAEEDLSTLALPGNMLGLGLWRRFPVSFVDWLAGAPMLFVGVLVLAALCWRGRVSWRPLLLYGAVPLALLLVMETVFGGQVRYLVEAAPFLAVLAAAAFLRVRPRALGVVLATLLIVQPLAGSLRYGSLLGTLNTRVGLDALVAELNGAPDASPLTIAVHDRIVLHRGRLPPGVIEFPATDDLALRERQTAAIAEALRDTGTVIYARIPGVGHALGPLDGSTLRLLGFTPYGTIHAAPPGRLYLPDVPDRLVTDLWRATRTGPPIELWVASPEAGARLRRIAKPDELDAWTSDPAHGGGGGGASGARAIVGPARVSPAGALREVSCDIDGDGIPDSVASNVDGRELARLLHLPTDRWRDAGGTTPDPRRPGDRTAAAGGPHVVARGTLFSREPVLLLLTGAAPRSAVYLVVGTRELRARCAGGLLVPSPDVIVAGLSTGASGSLALTALWPTAMPIGLSVVLQCWIHEPSATRSIRASNAVAGTTPG